MSLKKLISLVFVFCAFISIASAQTSLPLKKQGETYNSGRNSGTSGMSGSIMDRTKIMGTRMDVNVNTARTDKFGQYEDERLKDLDKDIQERAWNSEDTAWERACALGDEASFKRYLAMYPYGAHSGEANKKIIDIHVDEALKNAHNELPGIDLVEEDEDSPTSTILIKNNTEYPLTVYYSGVDSKSTVIAAYHSATVVVKNGDYKIAASVPDAKVRPYAGITTLVGGKYETGYYIVRR